MAEYIVYPSGRVTYSLPKAKRLAREDGRGARVENTRTEKVVYRVNPKKKKNKRKASKRMSAALTRWLKKQNPSKMKGVTRVRVRKLKGGGVTITPAK